MFTKNMEILLISNHSVQLDPYQTYTMLESASAKGKYKPSTTTQLNQFCLLYVSVLVKSHHQAN
jgi:hypothetical protein